MTQQKIIVAIDGPAGAGKSTVAKLLAKELHYLYIDTGAMYRALTLKVQRNNINVADEKAICALMHETEIKLLYADGLLTVLLDEKDVSEEIRKPRISNSVSDIAKIPGVRALMTSLQRDYAKNDNCVLEGRDIGTVVFPKAQFKFYIDADFNERTRRRFKELQEKTYPLHNRISKKTSLAATLLIRRASAHRLKKRTMRYILIPRICQLKKSYKQ